MRRQVTQAYSDAVAVERRLTTAFDHTRIANDALRGARVRVRAGRGSPIEEQRADFARVNAESAAENARRILESARINLGRRIGQPVVGPLDLAWLDTLSGSYGPQLVPSAEGALALAAADADLAVADAEIGRASCRERVCQYV